MSAQELIETLARDGPPAHGGGFLPNQSGRLSRGLVGAPPAARAASVKPPESYMRSLFFDTVVHDVRALQYLIDVVGPQQVVIGSDVPFPLQMSSRAARSSVRSKAAQTVPPRETQSCPATRTSCSAGRVKPGGARYGNHNQQNPEDR